MKLQSIQQPTFQMKWKQNQLGKLTKSSVELDNGNKLLIRDEGWYKLQSLYDEVGRWVKSKLRYYKGKQVVKEVRSYNDVNQMD